MSSFVFRALSGASLASVLAALPALAAPLSLEPPRDADRAMIAPSGPPQAPAQAQTRVAARGDMGGGLIQFLFGGGSANDAAPPPRYQAAAPAAAVPAADEEGAHPALDPKFLPQTVAYTGSEKPGTIIIDTPNRFLFLVEPGGVARRYGIGVGRPGFAWAGVKEITAKREWPDWRPPPEMIARQPYLPTFMAGGPENPLGARAMYLGSSLYRIHGSNEPWTIGGAVSSGCIRMRNEDVIDLYSRVKVGTRVIVI
ncbi:MAG TPA: L,D-transpeptidase [Xanthobacteraceae bacterium]|nr:L,D-transpeptidase [Xanthobacteraceae bacterium]